MYNVEILTNVLLVVRQIQQLEMAESKALNHLQGAVDDLELLILQRYHIRNLMLIVFSAEALNGLLPQLSHAVFQR